MSQPKPFKRTFAGLKLHIDRPKGFVQEGKDGEGKPWKRVYRVDYGYIPRTEGGDGEDLDVFLGPDPEAKSAYWITQVDHTGAFDEYKVMLGFPSSAAAKACYLQHVPARFFSSLTTVPMGVLHALLARPMQKAAMVIGLLHGIQERLR